MARLRPVIIILLLLAAASGFSQEPYFTQFYNAPIFYNPGFIGFQEGFKARMNYRDHWPKYSNSIKSYHFSGDFGEREIKQIGGFGITANTNKEGDGFIRVDQVGLLGSVRVKVADYWVSQLGIQGSFMQKKIDVTDYIFSDQLDHKHGLILDYSSFGDLETDQTSHPDLNMGAIINYTHRNISTTFGLAVHHVLRPEESFLGLETRTPRKFVVHGDMIILEDRNRAKGFKYNPAIMFENYAGFNTMNIGMNLAKSALYAGIWYRNQQSNFADLQALIFLFGLNIPLTNEFSRMKVMYSYDVTLGQPRATGGTHEIALLFEFDQIRLIKSKSLFKNDYPMLDKPIRF